MFNKKECNKCGRKISSSYDFCPYCGNNLTNKKEDFGMLGNDDSFDEFGDLGKSLFGGFGGGMLNKMLKNAMNVLEKEMQKEMASQEKKPKSNFQLFINGKRVPIQGQPQLKTVQKKVTQEIQSTPFSKANQKKFTSLPQEEPVTSIRRLSDSILYEITLPNVKSLEDISVVKLENSYEIKAIGLKNSYFKSILVNLPLINYEFENEKLLLEFKSQN